MSATTKRLLSAAAVLALSLALLLVVLSIDGGEPAAEHQASRDAPRPVDASLGPPDGLLIREDPMKNPDPEQIWGVVNVRADSRVGYFSSGGPDGGPFRRLRVEDGDDVKTISGERAELGRNEWRYETTDRNDNGTFMLYREGERKLTRISYRLPASFPTDATRFNNIMQMKFANPADTGATGGPLAVEVRSDQFQIYHTVQVSRMIWHAPVVTGRWVDFAFDITYSQNPAVGRVQVWADYGSGWVGYPPITDIATLQVEQSGASENLPPGSSVPSFLAAGVYHSATLPPTHVDISDVSVAELP